MTNFETSSAAQFDTGPLSWVMAEIREALGRSRTALFEAGGREPEDQSTALQHARSHLHQAHGALQIVDVDGVTLMTQVAEEALDRFKSGALKCNADNARTVANLYQAVIEFLEELLAGAPFQPVRLFPYYRAVQEMLGAERIHPADLFFPDLSALARMPAAMPSAAPDYTAYRQRFERALLPYMKATERDAQTAQAAALRDAVAQVAEAQGEPKARTFWLAMQAFAELAAAGQLDHGRYVKQLFGLINLQMRRMAQGDTSLPDTMLREALFFIAGADHDHVSPLAHHLCSVFGVEGTVPADVEAKRYGRIDTEALARAKEAMAAAKAAWQRLLDAAADPQLDARFGQELAVVAVACDKLGVAALATLMRQLAQVANAAAAAGRSEALSLEMTTALLFAEHGLEHIRHLPDTFPAHADTIGVRLQALLAGDGDGAPPPAQWQLGLAHQLQQDDTVAALAGEMKAGLRQVEKVLDDYYGDPSLRPSLRGLDSVLHQLHGALAILDQDDAVFAAEHVRKEVAKLAQGLGDPAQEPRQLDEIAQNVGALGFFVDMLAQNPAGARERYAFDAAQGAFRAVPFKKIAASAPVPVLDEEVASPTSPPTPAPQVEAQAGMPADTAIEEELLDIFIAEAQEVLVFVNETLAKPRAEAGTLEHLTMLRRSFHTLKGSGRMVGLNQFADAAAAIERTMNTWLAEERPATEALFGLLQRAAHDLTAWVDELVAEGVSPRNADALAAAAARVQQGGAFEMAPAGAEAGAADDADAGTIARADADADADAGAFADVGMPGGAAATAFADPDAGKAANVAAGVSAGADAGMAADPVADAFADAGMVAKAAVGGSADGDAGGAAGAAGDASADADAAVPAGALADAFTDAEAAAPAATLADASANADAGVAASAAASASAGADADMAAGAVADVSADATAGGSADAALEAAGEQGAHIVNFTPPPAEPAEPVRDGNEDGQGGEDGADQSLGQVIAFPLATPPAPTADVIEFHPNVAPLLPPEDDDVKHVGALTIPLPLYNIYLAETDELARLLARDFGEWRHEPRRPASAEALQAAHTLAGTSATVGFTALRDLAHALENTLDDLHAPAPQLDPTQHDLLDFTVERIHQMLLGFAQGDVAPEQPELIQALQRMREELARLRAPDGVFDAHMDAVFADAGDAAEPGDEGGEGGEGGEGDDGEAALAARLDALFVAAYNDLSGKPPPESDFIHRDPVLMRAPEPKTASPVNDDIDDLFDSAFDDAFAAPLSHMPAPAAQAMSEGLIAAAPPDQAPAPVTQDVAPYDADAGQAAGPQSAAPEAAVQDAVSQHASALEAVTQEILTPETPTPETVTPETAAPAATTAEAAAPGAVTPDAPLAPMLALDESLLALDGLEPELPELAALSAEQVPPRGTLSGLPHGAPSPDVEVLSLPDAPVELAAAPPGSYTDEIDSDLLPVFLEEGADLLPQVGQALRAWQRNPADFSHANLLQRVLHTVKGSARMAGAMRLGQHAHEIETHIENMVHANSATPHAFEELLTHYDHALVLFEQLQHPQPAAPQPAAPSVPAQSAPAAAPAPSAPSAQDDDSASRTPLVRVRADILDRLVNQAGEVSILRSRLENEVGSLRTSLNDFSDNLARLRRQLREVEMQAESQIASRMSISSDREFDPLEFDRFTRLQELTRMMAESVNDVASFHESLLRSVETASTDLTQQARMTRELQRDLMRVRMVPFASISERLFRVARLAAKETDKRVNLDIRGGAVEIDRGVLERMAAPFEHLLRNAIVHGVESRAERHAAGKDETGELLIQVSQQGNEVVLAFSDDGAGLDLERIRAKARSVGLLDEGETISDAEAASLIFEPGFSTAETLTEQAGRGVGMDVVRSEAQLLGGRVETATERGKGACFTIHLPLTLAVTQVVLVRAGGRPFAMPSTLVEQVLQMKEGALADARAKGHVALHDAQAALHYLPTMLGDAQAQPAAQRSSPVLMLKAGDERLAVQVDEVLGNREVVIKNIGPQLARMAGIAGATVLGSGEIVLILNPLALARHLAEHPELRVEPAAGGMQLVATSGRTIMVVDDSLTVRKVTQRLLEREGYHVVLAKDGVDALEQMRDVVPDMMLVDIEMPRMDGFDLTRNVRGDERLRDIPIIMITSRSADKHRNYAMQLGVNAYFGKPFQEPVLLGAIESLLARQAA